MSAQTDGGDPVGAFVDLVREYRSLVDDAQPGRVRELLFQCSILLPRIYVAAAELPDLGVEDEDHEPEVASPSRKLEQILGDRDHYQLISDPMRDYDAVTASISDDLADVYLDLVRPLIAFDAGRLVEAVWLWRFNLRGHCGAHIVNVMRPLHVLVHDDLPPEVA